MDNRQKYTVVQSFVNLKIELHINVTKVIEVITNSKKRNGLKQRFHSLNSMFTESANRQNYLKYIKL